MSLIKELQINISLSNYNVRSSSYSSNYDYILLDALASSSYSSLFRNDLKNLKIKTLDGTNCQVLYLPAYESKPAVMLVRIPVVEISQTTKLILAVYDKSTMFSSSLSTSGEVQFFDANSDTYSDFFESCQGLSVEYDSIDSGNVIRSRFVPMDVSCLCTKNLSDQPCTNGRVVFARFKRASGAITAYDSFDYPYGADEQLLSVFMQTDYSFTPYQSDMKVSSIMTGQEKDYCMLDGVSDLVMSSSWDAYNSGTDEEGDWKQYHYHMRAGTGFSASSDYLEGFVRNNPTHVHQTTYDEVMIGATFYEDSELSNFNYFDLKWLLVFPSPLFAANGIPTITVTEKDSKQGIRLYKGEHEYSKVYKGSTLLWDANDENLEDTGLHLPDKIINHNWDWVF
ncbi:hypothetical protein [uncultured Methanobrevibacter sp.]|uniref:hypothetical protein n=1 Tax=uncultured Methanobrevibacter sp. TaxID=253161 RepID=UPI0026008752|nr:hypothetical protein [uncultured Methanobrevibacter sp.]